MVIVLRNSKVFGLFRPGFGGRKLYHKGRISVAILAHANVSLVLLIASAAVPNFSFSDRAKEIVVSLRLGLWSSLRPSGGNLINRRCTNGVASITCKRVRVLA